MQLKDSKRRNPKVQKVLDAHDGTTGDAGPYGARVMDRFNGPAPLAAQVPTMVAHGAKTAPGLKLAAPAAAKAVPTSSHRIVPKSNHGIKPKAILPERVAVFKGA